MHELHVMHRPPRVPQALGLVPGWQTFAMSQQPVVQVDSQESPASALVPPSTGVHRPMRHASRGWQSTHDSPWRPHACTVVVVMHSLLRQQPLQFDGPHGAWQRPATQVRFCATQSTQTPPSEPQALAIAPERHVPFWQQPRQFAQVAPASEPFIEPASASEHAPETQAPWQALHAAPAVPQAEVSAPETHWPAALQQPEHMPGPQRLVVPQATMERRTAAPRAQATRR